MEANSSLDPLAVVDAALREVAYVNDEYNGPNFHTIDDDKPTAEIRPLWTIPKEELSMPRPNMWRSMGDSFERYEGYPDSLLQKSLGTFLRVVSDHPPGHQNKTTALAEARCALARILGNLQSVRAAIECMLDGPSLSREPQHDFTFSMESILPGDEDKIARFAKRIGAFDVEPSRIRGYLQSHYRGRFATVLNCASPHQIGGYYAAKTAYTRLSGVVPSKMSTILDVRSFGDPRIVDGMGADMVDHFLLNEKARTKNDHTFYSFRMSDVAFRA